MKTVTVEAIRALIIPAAGEFSVSRIVLFGSRADGSNREDSDVDLIVEFSHPVSLLTLAAFQCRLEELLGLDVDVIHGPLRDGDLIEVGKVVELYAA